MIPWVCASGERSGEKEGLSRLEGAQKGGFASLCFLKAVLCVLCSATSVESGCLSPKASDSVQTHIPTLCYLKDQDDEREKEFSLRSTSDHPK